MLFDIPAFSGETPRVSPRLLAQTAAQHASNTRLERGNLAPMRDKQEITDLGTARKTVYLHDASWLSWSGAVHVVPGPTDTKRLYITGDGVPKMRSGNNTYDLRIAAPTSKLVISNITTPDAESLETVLYTYTYVTGFGEESAPAPSSNALATSSGIVVHIAGFDTPPTDRNITKIRIYRSQTSSYGTTDYYFIKEIAPTTTYNHSLDVDALNEPMTTKDHDTPTNGLSGITTMPNGMMVAFNGRKLHFCEPYQPHAWPNKYSLTVDYDIVGLAAFGSQLAVLTTGTPYRGQGTEPSTFALEKIEENLPCLAARGIVDLGYAAAYPSTDGLVVVTASSANIVSKPLFTREQWQSLDPASFVASQFSGRYFFGFGGTLPGTAAKSGLIDLSGEAPYFIRTDETINCLYHDLRTGYLYMQADGDTRLYQWDDPGSGYLSLSWKSKLMDSPYPRAFAAAQFEGIELAVPSGFQAQVIADGTTIATITTLNAPVRLPSGKYSHWEVQIDGKVQLDSLVLAPSMAAISGRR